MFEPTVFFFSKSCEKKRRKKPFCYHFDNYWDVGCYDHSFKLDSLIFTSETNSKKKLFWIQYFVVCTKQICLYWTVLRVRLWMRHQIIWYERNNSPSSYYSAAEKRKKKRIKSDAVETFDVKWMIIHGIRIAK